MSEISRKNLKDLELEAAEKRLAIKNFRFSMSGSKSKNVREGRNLRRSLARVLTEINSMKTAKHE
jgi:ribosomal protein L29